MTRKEFNELSESDIITQAKYYQNYFESYEYTPEEYDDMPFLLKFKLLDEVEKNWILLYMAVGNRTNRLAEFLHIDIKRCRKRTKEIKDKLKN